MHLKRKQYAHTKHQTKYIHDMMWAHEAGISKGAPTAKNKFQFKKTGDILMIKIFLMPPGKSIFHFSQANVELPH